MTITVPLLSVTLVMQYTLLQLKEIHYVSQLFDKIRQSCQLHSQRHLSIRGRATVLNTLIFSKLWHVIRFFTFTTSELATLRGIGSSFINAGIFPKISFNSLTLPRAKGGLGILDPASQQNALQWRWLRPLLKHPIPAAHRLTPSIPYHYHLCFPEVVLHCGYLLLIRSDRWP